MPHCGVKNSAPAIAQDHKHRFVMPGPMIGRIRVSRCEYSHVFTGSTEGSVELIRAVHPDQWQALHNRVFGSARLDLEWEAISVRASRARGIVRDQLALLEIPHRTGLFCPAAPTADADHLIERRPVRERIVRGVDNHE